MLTASPHAIDLPKSGKKSHDLNRTLLTQGSLQRNGSQRLDSVHASTDPSWLAGIFHPDCWWHDMSAFQWDFRTIHGLDKVTKRLGKYQMTAQILKIRLHQDGQFSLSLAKATDSLESIESIFDFETKTGRGSGGRQVVQGADDIWKGYMMYTILKELKGA